jgi:hypothetical protein
MMAVVFIEQHERFDAIEAYCDRLTPEQIAVIYDAPDSAIIELRFGVGAAGTQLLVIEEG